MPDISEQSPQDQISTMVEWYSDDNNQHKVALLLAARAIQHAEKVATEKGAPSDMLGAGIFGIGRFLDSLRTVETVRVGLSSLQQNPSHITESTIADAGDWVEAINESEIFYNIICDKPADFTVASDFMQTMRTALEEPHTDG